jgi:hypothetical protein
MEARMIVKSELITLIDKAIRSELHPTRIERKDGWLITFADWQRFAIEVNLDDDDYDDCA